MSDSRMNEKALPLRLPALPIIALMLLLGVCLMQTQAELIAPWWVYLGFLVFLISGLLFHYFKPLWLKPLYHTWLNRSWFPSVLPCLMILAMGYIWALGFAQAYRHQLLDESLVGQDRLVEGVVVGLPDKSGRSVRFNFQLDPMQLSATSKWCFPKYLCAETLRISWYHHKGAIHSGERWRLMVRLKPPHGMQNEAGFDYEKWLYTQGVHATGYVRKSTENSRIEAAGFGINRIRENLLLLIKTVPDKQFQGLIQALTIGHKSAISPEQWLVLQRTGTSHLMAISGLHIGLIAGLVFVFVRRTVPSAVCKYVSAPQVAAVFSLLVAGCYALLAGFSVPTQRAFIMLLVVMLAVLMKRPALNLNTLALALIAVLVYNPVSVLSVGFWLSFLAVCIIALISSSRVQARMQARMPIRVQAGQENKKQVILARLSLWLQGARIQWLIALGMLPLSVLLFQQGSLISPLANMLVIPVVGLVIVPLSLLASMLSLFSSELSLWLFSQISVLFAYVWGLLEWLAQIPLASWQRSSVPVLHSALALLGVFLLLMPKGFPLRFSGIILLSPMLLYSPPQPAKGEFWMSVLDVGQGLSVLVQTTDHALLFDAGARFSERFDIGQRVVVPYLRHLGINYLDILLVSHKDNDHAGGVEAVLKGLQVQQLMANTETIRTMETGNHPITTCELGLSWQWNGVDFQLLSEPENYQKSNNKSCVLKVWNAYYSLLLPGDIEKKVERNMLDLDVKQLQTDVLVSPHHGSNSSSSQPWLKKLNPQIVLVSAGYKNRFGHPTDKNLQRYHQLGARVFNTAHSGMLKMKFPAVDGGKIPEPQQQRKDDIHYWNHRGE